MARQGVVVPQNAAGFPSDHVQLVVGEHRIHNRMDRQHGHGFSRQPLKLLCSDVVVVRAAADKHGIGFRAIEQKLPIGGVVAQAGR